MSELMFDIINYSEFAALARCETQWGYGYLVGEHEQGERKGLHLGTLLHLGADNWLRGRGFILPETWTDDINTGGKPGEVRTLRLSDFDPELVERARWLGLRYEAHYGETPPSDWEVLSSEEWLSAWVVLDGRTVQLVGRTDGVIRVDGKLWLREVKSYGSKNRLASVHVEPQPTIYYKLIEENYGEAPFGILYDGIYTYRWKPTKRTLAEIEVELRERELFASKLEIRTAAKVVQEREYGRDRDPAESFERAWPDRTPQQVELGMRHVANAVSHRSQLIDAYDYQGIDAMIPNVGQSCNSCGFKARCWAHLTGDDGDIEIEEEDGELDWDS